MQRAPLTLVWDLFPGGGSQPQILVAAAEHANDQGNTYAPMGKMADSARMSRQSANTALQKLRSERWLIACRVLGQGNVLAYQINISKLQRAIRADKDPDATTSNDVARAAHTVRERVRRRTAEREARKHAGH